MAAFLRPPDVVMAKFRRYRRVVSMLEQLFV